MFTFNEENIKANIANNIAKKEDLGEGSGK
jgi:hypothetical protein